MAFKMREVQLKVAQAKERDVNRGIIRLPGDVLSKLGLTSGDIVEVVGSKRTAGIAWMGYPGDEGLVRIDSVMRENAAAGLGDTVTVRKAETRKAKRIILAPSEPIRFSADYAEYFKRLLLNRPFVRGDVLNIATLKEAIPFTIVNTRPSGIVQVSNDTQLVIRREPAEAAARIGVSYEDIGGLDEAIRRIREMVELPLRHPEIFKQLGIDAPKGVLFHGPPGCGKTLLARAVANESDAYFISMSGAEVHGKYYGESEARLRQIFEQGEKNAPSIIFIDELDAIAPKREEVYGEVEKRVVSQMLSLMDGLRGRGQIVVIGATNRPNALDPALRRPGRFDREIVIGMPDRNDRYEILRIHTRGMPLAEDVDIEAFAGVTHGFSGADLAALCREAAMKALRRFMERIDVEREVIPPEVLGELQVTQGDFKEALREIEPSALKEVIIEVPNVRWGDVGGLEEAKQELKEAVEYPLKYREAFEHLGIRPLKGILLVGPPGCGKTMLAQAVATESEANFIAVRGPELLSMWVGESERGVREVFRKARQAAPSIVFFDEIDSLVPVRGGRHDSSVTERVVSQILTELDGLSAMRNVVVLAATNRPDILDPALLRPGRFDRIVVVPEPDRKARLEILKVHTRKIPLAKDVDLDRLAKQTEGYSGSDLESLCREAAMFALRECLVKSIGFKGKRVSWQHFEQAMHKIRPSVTKDAISYYEQVLREFGMESPKPSKRLSKGPSKPTRDRVRFKHLNDLPLDQRQRFQRAAERAGELLNIPRCTVDFRSPIGTSAEIRGKVYIEPTQTVLALSDDGLIGLFLHELAHSRHKMLDPETRRALLSHAPSELAGQWAVKILEDLLINDLLYSDGFGRFLTATDLDAIMMLKRDSAERFERAEVDLKFIIAVSLIGSYLDGKRYDDSELVELVKRRLEWFPEYVKDMTFRVYTIVRNVPILDDASRAGCVDLLGIGKKLISCLEKTFKS